MATTSPQVETHEQTPAPSRCFVARQPILDLSLDLAGYELLFRSGVEGAFPDGDAASAEVLSTSFMEMDIETLTSRKKAFVNFPAGLILNRIPALFPAESIAIEVLETVEPTEDILAALAELRGLGYTVLLDDFEFDGPWEAHVECADIIKVDYMASDRDQRLRLVQRASSLGIPLLAEKVETREQFKEALALGFSFFQGYFFFRPETVSTKKIEGFKSNHLQLIHESGRPDLDLRKLTEIIKTNVSLSYRLLRFVNSAAFGWRKKTSIHHALSLLGSREVRRWGAVVSMSAMLSEHPPEVLTNCVARALFCEQLAPTIGMQDRDLDLYFLGLFSSLDVILNRPIEEILSKMPLNEKVGAALLGETGTLRDTLDLVVAYERGYWEQVNELVSSLHVDESLLPTTYREAIAAGSAIGNLGGSEGN